MQVQTNKEFYDIIKMAVTEAIREERINLYFSLLPSVSDEEMQDIENTFSVPSENVEYEDISGWFANESNNK